MNEFRQPELVKIRNSRNRKMTTRSSLIGLIICVNISSLHRGSPSNTMLQNFLQWGGGGTPPFPTCFWQIYFPFFFWPKRWVFQFPSNSSHCWTIFNPFDAKTPFLALFSGPLCRLSTKGGSIWQQFILMRFHILMTFEKLCIWLCIFFLHSKLVCRLLCLVLKDLCQ